MILVLLLGLFAGYAVSEPQCWTEYHAPHNWFGSPNYYDCQRLLFGNNDLSGIAAIDALSHAFIVPNTQREFESDSQWANRVVLPKFWANCSDPRLFPAKYCIQEMAATDCLRCE